MPKEITSKLTGKVQIISDETWRGIQTQGWAKKYRVRDIPEKKIPKPEEIIKPKKESNG
jgi:hypothetical protein